MIVYTNMGLFTEKETNRTATNKQILTNLQVKGTKAPVHGILQAAHAHLQHADHKIHQHNTLIRLSEDKSDTSKISKYNPKFWFSFNLCPTTGQSIHVFIQMKITNKEIQSNRWFCAFDPLQLHIWACKCSSKMIHSESFDMNVNWTVYLVSFNWLVDVKRKCIGHLVNFPSIEQGATQFESKF